MRCWLLNGIAGVLMLALGGCVAAVVPPGMLHGNAAQPQQGRVTTQQRGAVSGVVQRVGFFYSEDPDCTSAGLIQMSIKDPPAHGTVVFRQVEDFPNFPVNNPRHACDNRKVRGVGVFYTSDSAYTGDDRFSVRGVGPRGALAGSDYVISVMHPQSLQ